MEALFSSDLRVERLLAELELYAGKKFVLQQLKTDEDLSVYYYTNERGSCEIDFLLDDGKDIIPVEVKAAENLRAKSLRAYHDKYQPDRALRISLSDYREQEWLTNLPLYTL